MDERYTNICDEFIDRVDALLDDEQVSCIRLIRTPEGDIFEVNLITVPLPLRDD